MCPECGHFCIEAMERHFPKGLRIGLLRKFRASVVLNLAIGVLAGAGSCILALTAWDRATSGQEGKYWWGILIFLGVATLVAGAYALQSISSFARGALHLLRVRRAIGRASEGDLLDWTREAYRENQNSLGSGSTWIRVLALHARH